MKADELQSILDLHKKWLYGEGGERANLNGAYLIGANLSDADLSDASLSGADLRYANLRGANLSDAYLRGANLRGANLIGADLRYADLRDANIDELGASKLSIVPETGAFIGWKKCADKKVVKLRIQADAKRSNATGRKCRCSKAKVLSIENYDQSETFEEAISNYDPTFIYRVGESVEVDNFCEDRWDECAPGIHFFITRAEAVDYQ